MMEGYSPAVESVPSRFISTTYLRWYEYPSNSLCIPSSRTGTAGAGSLPWSSLRVLEGAWYNVLAWEVT